jgi:hypothetical protein
MYHNMLLLSPKRLQKNKNLFLQFFVFYHRERRAETENPIVLASRPKQMVSFQPNGPKLE